MKSYSVYVGYMFVAYPFRSAKLVVVVVVIVVVLLLCDGEMLATLMMVMRPILM